MSESLTAFELLWQIDQRCRLLAADLPSQAVRPDRWSGIGFRLGEHWYVAPMGEVSEVLHEPRFTQLPGVKPWVKGVANLRGRLLPIMTCAGSSATSCRRCVNSGGYWWWNTKTCSPG